MERALRPALGRRWAFISKWLVGKSMWAMAGIWAATYYGLYCAGDWKRQTGWKYHVSKPPTMPGQPGFPNKNPKYERGEAWMYNDQVRRRSREEDLLHDDFLCFRGSARIQLTSRLPLQPRIEIL